MADEQTLWGSTITIEVTTTAATVDPPTWLDISRYVTFREAGAPMTASGRQTDLSGDDPAQLTLAVRDDDKTFAAGTVLRQGRRIRIREHIGLSTFDLVDAEITQPAVSVPMDIAGGSQAEVTVTIAATDLLGRMRSARPFISTLSEYIRFKAGSTLRYYWALADPSPPFASSVGPAATLAPSAGTAGILPTEIWASGPHVVPNGGTPVLADDVRPVVFATDLNSTLFAPSVGVTRYQQISSAISLPVNGDTVTVAFWLWPDNSQGDGAAAGVPVNMYANFEVDARMYFVSNLGDGVNWSAILTAGAGSAFLVTPRPRMQAWNLIALQMSLLTLQCTAFVHTLGTVTGPFVGAVNTAPTFDTMVVGGRFNGSIAHVQVYVGATAYTQATHDAQIQAARTGLEGQLTGERVTSILDYAGWPAGARDIDPGLARMSVARLAGKDPLTCLEEARRTEQGRLFSAGSFGNRRVEFRDRLRSYNN